MRLKIFILIFLAFWILEAPYALAHSFADVVESVQNALRPVVPILIILATIVFLWGIILYITAKGDEEKIREGRTYIIWGLTGLFVIVALWGIVKVFVATFFPSGLPPAPPIPTIPGSP